MMYGMLALGIGGTTGYHHARNLRQVWAWKPGRDRPWINQGTPFASLSIIPTVR